MQLSFRGHTYEATTPDLLTETVELAGKYRGQPVTFSQARAIAPAHRTLSYRGVRYER